MFLTELELKVIGDQAYELTQPLIYSTTGMTIQVGKGFDFDGASIPRIFWSVIGSPLTGGYQRAAALHDALYACECFPREICDALFLEAMLGDNVNVQKTHALYWAVRFAGWIVWKKHTKGEVNAYKKFVYIEPSYIA